MIVKYLLILLAVYLVLVGAVFVMQRRLLYYPDAAYVTPESYGLPDFQAVELNSADNLRLNAWYHAADEGFPTILYLHGNAGNLSYRQEIFSLLAREGYGLLALSYRGYGGSEGSPSEAGLYSDAESTLDYLHDLKITDSSIIYYGESLGSGVATWLAEKHPPLALILNAPFTSVAERAGEIYWFIPARLMTLDKFDSISRIRQITAPLLIIHGDQDTIVPISHGRRLLEAAAAIIKELSVFEGHGHLNMGSDLVVKAINKFLAEKALFSMPVHNENNSENDSEDEGAITHD